MARETKVGLLIGVGLILLIGIIISDHLTVSQAQRERVGGTTDPTTLAVAAQDGIVGRPVAGQAPQTPRHGQPAPAETPVRGAPPQRVLERRPVLSPEVLSDPSAVPPVRGVPLPPRSAAADRLAAIEIPAAATLGPAAATPARTGLGGDLNPDAEAAARPMREIVESNARTGVVRDLFAEDAGIAAAATQAATPEPTAAAATTVTASATRSAITHRTRRDETLADVARIHYGDAELWRALRSANPAIGADIEAVDALPRNTRLVIPDRTRILTEQNRLLREELARVRQAAERPTVLPRGTGIEVEPVVLPQPPRRPAVEAAQPVLAVGPVEPVERSEAGTVEVRPGDSLSRLAARHLGSAGRYRDLYDANRDRLDSPDAIRPGMRLRLPDTPGGSAPSAAPAPGAAAAVSRPATYTVAAGDNLSRIAGERLGDRDRWRDVYELNRDQLRTPDSLRVGQVLRLP